MDSRLKEALDFSNYMITLNNQKRILKEQYYNDLIFYHNGGQFTITQGLVSFCQSLVSLEQENTIIVDDNDIPVEIDDLKKFTNDIIILYAKATNRYLLEYNKLKTNRTVEGIIDL